MLSLKREEGERIVLTTGADEMIVVTVLKLGRGRVQLGFDAPHSVRIEREEIIPEHLRGTT